MADGFDPSVFPDPHRVILPSRAYLRSVKEQTIPARRLALGDAENHFSGLCGDEDVQLRDMALLGLVGEAMQVLEDLAYFARAYERPLLGLPNYVTATVYSERTPTNFFGSLKNWSEERLMVLAGLRVTHRRTGRVLPLLELLGVMEQLEEAELAALGEAERATAGLLRKHLLRLARSWTRFGPYFHAFKHSALAINREDFRLVEEDGTERRASIAVWRRKKEQPFAHGDAAGEPEEVRQEVVDAGRLALDVLDFLVDSRLRLFDDLEINTKGQLIGMHQPRELWGFWVEKDDLSPEAYVLLERRFGTRFTPLSDAGNETGARPR